MLFAPRHWNIGDENDEDKRGALLMPTDAEVKEALQRNDFKKDATLLLYLMESKINPNFTNHISFAFY